MISIMAVKTMSEIKAKYNIGDDVVFHKKISNINTGKPETLIGQGVIEGIHKRSNDIIYYSIRFGKVIIRCAEDCVAPNTKLFDKK